MTGYRDVHNEDWLKLASNLNGFVNFIANRDDLIVHATPETDTEGTAHMAAGYFISEQAAVYFDTAKFMNADDDPSIIDPFDAFDRIKYIDLIGVAAHEAAHAAHTDPFNILLAERKNILESNPKVTEWFMALEESRIEKSLIDRRPREREMLRGSISSLIKNVVLSKDTPDDEVNYSKYATAHIAVLILARVDAGVLEEADFIKINDQVEKTLGSELLNDMRELWNEAHLIVDGDFEGMFEVAEKLSKLLTDNDVQSPDNGNSMGFSCGADYGINKSTDGEGTSPVSDQSTQNNTSSSQVSTNSGEGDALQAAMETSRGQAKESIAEDAASDIDKSNPFEKRLEALNAETAAREEMKKKANEAFPDGNIRIKGNTSSGYSYGASNLNILYVTPTDKDMSYARGITNKLRKAQYRDIVRTKRRADIPPGKVRAGELMRRDAQIARQAEITATPWTRISRRVSEQPPIILGISFDVSGSLGAWVRDISAFSWAITQALHTVNGTVATVAWDTEIRGVIAPGKFPKNIPVISSGGGTSAIVPSLESLDGALNLCQIEGVRVLVILTDGDFHNGGDANKAINKFVKAGVQVIYCHIIDNGYYNKGFVPSNKNVTYAVLRTPEEFAPVVGNAMIKALKKHETFA